MNPETQPNAALPANRLDAESRQGCLYLIPTPLDHGCVNQTPLENVLPLATIQRAASLRVWVTENAKSTRAFLKRIDAVVPLGVPMQSMVILKLAHELHKKGDHDFTLPRERALRLLGDALAGKAVGLMSEAGMPALADPGSSVVRAAHELGIAVIPLVGPISIGLALAASGCNGQNFAFVGYLPREPQARTIRVQALEKHALRSGQTQLFIEAPYRNRALLAALLEILRPTTRLCVACGLTLDAAAVRSACVQDWRAGQPTLQLELPAVFAIGR